MAENYTISEVLANEFELQTISPQDNNLLSEVPVEGLFSPTLSSVEFSLYDFNKNLLYFDSNLKSWSTNFDSFVNSEQQKITSLNIDLSKNIEALGYGYGKLYGFYNFIQNELGSSINNQFFISEISSDRTEIRIDNTNISSDSLEILFNDFYVKFNSSETYNYFYLNFGDNQLLIATNIYLDKSSSDYSILVKLYEPLLPQFNIKSQCYVSSKIADPVAYLVDFTIDLGQIDNIIQIQGPNINLNINDQVNNSTTYQSFDTLTSTVNTSSFNQLISLLEEKGVEINIDYTDYSNFIFYSSAASRLENFYIKTKQIEDYNNEINILNSLSTTAGSSGSIVLLEQYISDIITNFDGYEYYLYFESGSKAWPKTNLTPPYLLASTGSVAVLNWYGSNIYGSPYYGGQLESASLYDSNNQDTLTNTVTDYLNDYNSDQYLTFVKMIGQSFDNIWVYIKSIVDKNNTDNRLDFGAPSGIIADILRSLGVKIYSNNFSVDNAYESLLGIGANGALYPTGSELINTIITASTVPYALSDVNNLTYKRLYHNLPYILKKKGTPEGLKAILNVYGIPDTILRINEFGGKDKNPNTWDQWQNEYSYAFTNSDLGRLTIPFTALSSPYGTTFPKAIEFRFKTSGLPTSSIPYSQSLFVSSGSATCFGVFLEYTGSGYNTGSYNGSIIDPDYQYATLKFISGSLSSSVYLPFYNGDWWSILINADSSSATTYTLYAKNKIYDGVDGNTIGFQASSSFTGTNFWRTAGALVFGTGSVLNGKTYNTFSGSYQEIRYYNIPLSESAFNDYVMNPSSIEGNTLSGSQSSYNSLFFRLPLGGELYTGSTSVHPGITGSFVTQSFTGAPSTGSFSGSYSFINNTETIFYDQPDVGIQNIVSNKLKIINTSLPYSGSTDPNIPYNKTLSPFISIQQNYYASSSYTNDVNYVEVAFSPQNEINEDIMSTLGYFNIGDYIGDPRQISSNDESYPDLDVLRTNYFQKYFSNYDWNDYLRLIKFFDNSLFKTLQDFIPVKTSLASGTVIKQNLLERNKYPVPQMEFTQSEYTGSIPMYTITGSDGGSFPNLSSSLYSQITQSWIGSYSSYSGSIPYTQDDLSEFFDGELSGSNLIVENGELSSCYLTLYTLYTNASLGTVQAVISSYPGPSLSIPFNIDYDKTYYISFSYNNLDIGNSITIVDNIGTSLYTVTRGALDAASGTINNIELKNALYPIGFNTTDIGGCPITNVTLSKFDFNDLNNDCDPLLNNAVDNRLNSYYMDVDYSNNSIIPVNQQLLLTGSAFKFPIPDSNYTSYRSVNPRYDGSKTTSPDFNLPIYNRPPNTFINNQYSITTPSTKSQVPNASRYSNYFVYFDWIGGANPQYPGGGNIHCTYLIGIDGVAIPLTTNNVNLNTIENIFVKGKTANIFPVVYSAGSSSAQVEIVEGGALYDTIMYTTYDGSTILSPGFSVFYSSSYQTRTYVGAFITQSDITLTDTGSIYVPFLYPLLTGSSPISGSIRGVSSGNMYFYNKTIGDYVTSSIINYSDTYLPLQIGDIIRFGDTGSSDSSSLDSSFTALGQFQIASISIGTEVNKSSSITLSSINTINNDIFTWNSATNYVQKYRIMRRIPNESFVLVKNNPSYGDPGFLVPTDFNPNYDVYTLAKKAGIIS